MIPLTLAFGAYLYVTRDDGFRFDRATIEHRQAFVERQATRWAVKSGITGFGIAETISTRVTDDGRSATLKVVLAEGSALRTEPVKLRKAACLAYNESRMSSFDIRLTAYVLRPNGTPAYSISVNSGRCASTRPLA